MESDAVLRATMLETLAGAAFADSSPRELRAAFRLLSPEGTVISEAAGPLATLRDPIASLFGGAGAKGGGHQASVTTAGPVANSTPAGGMLLCSVDPYDAPGRGAVEQTSPAVLADFVAAAGIAAVGVATPGSAAFVHALRERGVDVRTEVCAAEAILFNEAPIVAARRGSPFVHLFACQSVDGRALSIDEAPSEVAKLRADLEGVETAAGAKLADVISGASWDRLTLVTAPVVRGRGPEILGDLGISDTADVRWLNNAAWWTRSGMVILTGYRDPSETFGPRLARTIGATVPLPFGLHGVEPVGSPGEGSATERSEGRGAGVLAALGYHRSKS